MGRAGPRDAGRGKGPKVAGQILVIHERVAQWARQLRPRMADRPVRVVETRSTGDLETALAGAACPLVVIDLARRRRAAMEDLDRAVRAAPDALVLVLDPDSVAGVARLARELGATHVIEGPATPPAVARWIARWIPLARSRADASGWSASAPRPGETQPVDWLAPPRNARPSDPRPPRE